MWWNQIFSIVLVPQRYCFWVMWTAAPLVQNTPLTPGSSLLSVWQVRGSLKCKVSLVLMALRMLRGSLHYMKKKLTTWRWCCHLTLSQITLLLPMQHLSRSHCCVPHFWWHDGWCTLMFASTCCRIIGGVTTQSNSASDSSLLASHSAASNELIS